MEGEMRWSEHGVKGEEVPITRYSLLAVETNKGQARR
jgi:hypothetical protein